MLWPDGGQIEFKVNKTPKFEPTMTVNRKLFIFIVETNKFNSKIQLWALIILTLVFKNVKKRRFDNLPNLSMLYSIASGQIVS